MLPRPPRPTLFPYTTLFRSSRNAATALPSALSSGSAPDASAHTTPAQLSWRVPMLTPPASSVTASRSPPTRSEEHTSELQSRGHLVCRLLLEKKKQSRLTSHSSPRYHCFSFSCSRDPRDLHSFPTRRSSDLHATPRRPCRRPCRPAPPPTPARTRRRPS